MNRYGRCSFCFPGWISSTEVDIHDFDGQPVSLLRLSTRASACLSGVYRNEKAIKTIGELLRCSDEFLLERNNLGRVTLLEIRTKLDCYMKEYSLFGEKS